MIQDIAPHILHNEYRPDSRPDRLSPVLCFSESGVLIKDRKSDNDYPKFPSAGEISEDNVYAFSVDDTEYYLHTGATPDAPEGYEYANVRDMRRHLPNLYGMIIFTGLHLWQWYKETKYCGCCAAKMIHSDIERAMVCPGCKRVVYPRLFPAVIVGVISGGRLLVTKYKTGFNNFALVAGFVEIGETVEDTVTREVFEETGLHVKNICYYKSQPWGIVQDVLMGFYCEADGSEEVHPDSNELKLAEWRTAEEIELQPDDYSLTNDMMKRFKEGKQCLKEEC